MTIRVTIRHLSDRDSKVGKPIYTVYSSRSNELDLAIQRALKKHGWGSCLVKNDEIKHNNGRTVYGVIGRPIPQRFGGGVNVSTGPLRIDVEWV